MTESITQKIELLIGQLAIEKGAQSDISIALTDPTIKALHEIQIKVKQLEHFRDTTVGLYAVDRHPRNVSHEWIKANCFRIEELYK